MFVELVILLLDNIIETVSTTDCTVYSYIIDKNTMVLLLFALIMAATADPDYYAVKIKKGKFKIFTHKNECERSWYQNGGDKILFFEGVWKIAKVKNGLKDCETKSSVVEKIYQTKNSKMPEGDTWHSWTDKRDKKNIDIWVKSFNKSDEITDLKLVTGTKEEAETKEDCFGKEWGEKSDKDIVVAFQNSKCFYDFVDQARLENDSTINATIVVYPSGKN